MISKFSFGDIVLADMIFTDQSDKKKRPILILSREGEDYLGAFITSQVVKHTHSYLLMMNNENKLRADSTVLLHKMAVIHETLLGNRLGYISDIQKNDIKQGYIKYFTNL